MPKAAPSATKTPAQPSATMTGLAGWVEVFKAGDHIDSKGRPISFSVSDLDQMVTNHQLGSAPAVVGHPTDKAPAYAWTDGLKRVGDCLFAKFRDINPAFESAVKAKTYPNRSLSTFKDKAHGWRVRHVGWLGGVPPAIDGLAPVEFAAAEDEVFEFATATESLVWGRESVGRLLRGLREHIVAKEGIEAADDVLPTWQIDSVVESANAARTQLQEGQEGRLFNQPAGNEMTITPEQLAAAEARAREEATASVRAEFAAKDQELVQLRAERQRERINAQITGWKSAGKVLPAEEAGLAEFMASLEDAGAEFTFSAAGGQEAKKTPAVFFAEFMAGRAPVLKLGKTPGQDPAPAVDLTSGRAIADAAREFQAAQEKAGRTISIDAAIAHVSATHAA